VTEASLAIARKVVLCAGVLVAALLFLFPHWSVSYNAGMGDETRVVDEKVGRYFIDSPPPVILIGGRAARVTRIHYVRQFTEVTIALLLTLGLMRALKLKKPAGD
jgi:hypothetical protein